MRCSGYEIDGGKLVIPLVRESDGGDYICTATNEEGTATGSVRLQIRGDVIIRSWGRAVFRLANDESCFILCVTKRAHDVFSGSRTCKAC